MKKIIALLLVLVMAASIFPLSAFAEDGNKNANMASEIIVTVSNQAEAEALLNEIQAHKQYANMLWEKAVLQARSEGEYVMFSGIVYAPMPLSGYTVNRAYTDFWYSLLKCTICFTASYELGSDSYGHDIITAVYGLDGYATTSQNSATVSASSSSIIDHGRTISANYTMRVGIYNERDGVTHYTTDSFHVEFYANGASKVY